MTRYKDIKNENELNKNIDGLKKAKQSEQFNIDFNIILNQPKFKNVCLHLNHYA